MPFPLDDFTRRTIQNHFRRKKLEWTETYFINVLETSPQKHDIYWATIALRDCGTSRCIPALKAKLHYPMKDVKCTTILTVAHICRETETEFYTNALLDPRYQEKTYAMWAIKDAADPRAVGAVITYFRKNMTKLRNGTLYNGGLADGFAYLERNLGNSGEVTQFFGEIQTIWQRLHERTRREITGGAPRFGEAAGRLTGA